MFEVVREQTKPIPFLVAHLFALSNIEAPIALKVIVYEGIQNL